MKVFHSVLHAGYDICAIPNNRSPSVCICMMRTFFFLIRIHSFIHKLIGRIRCAVVNDLLRESDRGHYE